MFFFYFLFLKVSYLYRSFGHLFIHYLHQLRDHIFITAVHLADWAKECICEKNEPTWRCHDNPLIGALGIHEPVILHGPVITNLLSPFPSLIEWVSGGHYVYNPTLNRFFLFHFHLSFILCCAFIKALHQVSVTCKNLTPTVISTS